MRKVTLILSFSLLLLSCNSKEVLVDSASFSPIDYVNPLVGTLSKFSLSTGNTYPAIALPWGMNFWTPQTGEMGNGWTYSYTDDQIVGFKQTHQPSPWINDYGQFSLMPVTGGKKFLQNERSSWFSHKAETAKPYYYSVYLADHDVKTEITPTERSAYFMFTFPKSEKSYIVVDAFDNGSFIQIDKEHHIITGYTTKNSGVLLNQILELLLYGPLLSNTIVDWLDEFKDAYSSLSIDLLRNLLDIEYRKSDREMVLRITDIMFLHDPLNEEALAAKCSVLFLEGKKGIAKSVYDRFCKEYRESLGEDYKIPLSKLCE